MTIVRVNPEQVGHALREEAMEQVSSAAGELLLDFSSVARVDADGVRALEELARLADVRSVKVALGGVNMDIYKVLKLMKLTGCFTFRN